uniref:Capsid protein n=1 Tax=Genomoviridae sp. TaxID=2202565 RepID=A0A858NG83_9VIRU|nr:MAG: capsid protein [Genomoviridae sp.]
MAYRFRRRYTPRTTYRKSSRRYSGRSRRYASSRKKSWSLGRRRRQPIRARRFKRRVLAISQTKKSDKMLGANGLGVQTGFVLAATGGDVAYNLWSPPTREYDNQEVDPQDRNRQDIFFVGWKDVMYMEIGQALIWRRIIFWSYERYEFAQSVLNSSGNYFRRWEPYTNSTHPEVTQDILRGTEGIDYAERFTFDAQTDSKKIRVIYDKKRVINPKSTIITVKNYKMWHPIRRKIVFDNPESGDSLEEGVWSVESPNSAGNLYVLDMFAHAVGSTGASLSTSIRPESTVYWRET